MPVATTRFSAPNVARRAAGWATCVILGASWLGCTVPERVETLELRLRENADSLSELQTRLEDTESELALAHKQADALRAQLAGRGEQAILPEQADVLFRVAGIKVNTLASGLLDQDGDGVDDGLTIVLAPHDAGGELLKVPGAIDLELRRSTGTGEARPVGSWTFSAEESRRNWQRNLFATGFRFDVPWKAAPHADRLVVRATLTAPDGRRFETEVPLTLARPASDSSQAAGGHSTRG